MTEWGIAERHAITVDLRGIGTGAQLRVHALVDPYRAPDDRRPLQLRFYAGTTIPGAVLAACRVGENRVVTKLDRLARSLPDAACG